MGHNNPEFKMAREGTFSQTWNQRKSLVELQSSEMVNQKKKTMSPASLFSVDAMVNLKVSFQGRDNGWNRTGRRLKGKTETTSR